MNDKALASVLSEVASVVGGLNSDEVEVVKNFLAATVHDVEVEDVVQAIMTRRRAAEEQAKTAEAQAKARIAGEQVLADFIHAHQHDLPDTAANARALLACMRERGIPFTREGLEQGFQAIKDNLPNMPAYNPGTAAQIAQESALFLDEHPEFFESPQNWAALRAVLAEKRLPITRGNLTLALEACQKDNTLDAPRRVQKVDTGHSSFPGSALPPLPKDFAAQQLANQARAHRTIDGIPRNNDALATLEAETAAQWRDARLRNSSGRRFR